MRALLVIFLLMLSTSYGQDNDFVQPVGAPDSEAVEEARPVSELDPRVFEIARALRCPVCRAESVADSNAPVSVEMRQIIQEQLANNATKDEILRYFQARYGDYILLEPPRRGIYLIVWLLPVVALGLGAWWLLGFIRRANARAATPPEISEDARARVRELLHD